MDQKKKSNFNGSYNNNTVASQTWARPKPHLLVTPMGKERSMNPMQVHWTQPGETERDPHQRCQVCDQTHQTRPSLPGMLLPIELDQQGCSPTKNLLRASMGKLACTQQHGINPVSCIKLKYIHKVMEQRFLATIIMEGSDEDTSDSKKKTQYPSTTTLALDMLNAFRGTKQGKGKKGNSNRSNNAAANQTQHTGKQTTQQDNNTHSNYPRDYRENY
eukprot:jgi/Psemu1/30093/gm1.30093_g